MKLLQLGTDSWAVGIRVDRIVAMEPMVDEWEMKDGVRTKLPRAQTHTWIHTTTHEKMRTNEPFPQAFEKWQKAIDECTRWQLECP